MNTRLLIMFCMVLLLLSCRRTKRINVSLNKRMAEAFSFQPGTWWVYKDSATGVRDSVVVTQRTNGMETKDMGHEALTVYYIEQINCSISCYQEDSLGNWTQPASVLTKIIRFEQDSVWIGIGSYSKNWDSSWHVYGVMRYPVNETVPAVMLRGNTYSNVVQNNSSYGYTTWYNQEVGFIKLPVHNESKVISSWELEKYNIVR